MKLISIFKIILISFSCVLLAACAGVSLRGKAPVAMPSPPVIPAKVHRIALLLPLTGNAAAVSGKAIRNGFLAAYYAEQPQGGGANGVSVKVIDIANKNIASAYQEAVAANVDVVVGPLTKQEVADVAAMGAALPLPTLALNTLDDYQTHVVPNLYQFGLSPQDEVVQAATKILQDGHRRVALLVPASSWGNSLAEAFNSKLSSLGGTVVTVVTYNTQDDFDAKVRQLLQKPASATSKDAAASSSVAPSNIEAVLLLTTPSVGRQVAPLIKFYTKNSMPMYGISTLYAGFIQSDLDRDLDGVIFCDMPWTIVNPADWSPKLREIRTRVSTIWPDALRNNARLYALGIDAYNVAISLNNLVTSAGNLHGVSGVLSADNYNHIYRQLTWTSMKQGIPQGL